MRSLTLAILLVALFSANARAEPLRDAVAAYGVFQDDANVVRDVEITSPAIMDLVLERVARHERDALARGYIAYSALSAAQSRAFVEGVQSRVRSAGRVAVLRQLRRDAGYARRRPPGSAEAVRIVLDAAAADGARLNAIANLYEATGRRLQDLGWPHPTDEARAARMAHLRALANTTPPAPDHLASRLRIGSASASPLTDVRAFGGRHFWDSLSDAPYAETPSPPAWRMREARTATVDRMLTLAALYIVEATDEESARVAALLEDTQTQECLNQTQLHFRQCASVAYGADEDAFCLARHGMRDVGVCFAAIAQAS